MTAEDTQTTTPADPTPTTASGPNPRPGEMDGAMRTGQAADDEPTMSIGERHAGEPPADVDGDGKLSVEEADALLRGEAVDVNSPAAGTHQTT